MAAAIAASSMTLPAHAAAPWAPTIEQCTDPAEDALHDAVLVELKRLLEEAQPNKTQLTIHCGEKTIALTLVRGTKVLNRRVARSELPARGKARFVALIAGEMFSELLRAASTSRPTTHPATRPQSVPAIATTRPIAPAPAEPRWRVAVGVLVGAMGSPRKLQLGGALALGHRVHPNFGWRVDLQIAQARRSVVPGEISLTSISLAPSALVHLEWKRWGLAVGPGLRLGGLDFAGAAESGAESNDFRAFFWGGLGLMELSLRLSARWLLALAGEAGYHFRPVEARADDVAAWAAEGAWFSAFLGLFYLF